MSIKPGQHFGRYRVEKALGSGGMGSVFLAHDSRLGRPVAIKTTLEGRNAGDKTLERFYREARAAANFRHPNLCKVYDVGEIDGIHYLTMEYIEGRQLLDWLRPGEPLPAVETATAIAHGAAVGLAEAHRLGVIHRDLKPANIMIDRGGVTVIVDFGLARGEFGGEPDLTEFGTFLGTRTYASPEQWSGDPSRIGPASDIYSLGVVLYQMLSGRLPFVGPTPDVLMHQVLTATPDRPSASRPGLDPRLDEICLRAIARAPGDRFRSMGEFAESLLTVHQGHSRNGEGRAPDSPAAPDGATVEWSGPRPFPPPPGLVPDVGAEPGGVSKTVSEGPGASNEPDKRPLTGLNTFAIDDPVRPPGLGPYGLVSAAVAGLVVLALVAWLAHAQWRSSGSSPGPSTPREETAAGSGSREREDHPTSGVAGVGPSEVAPPVPSVSPRLTAPGRARVTSSQGDTLDVVRQAAYEGAPRGDPVRAGQEVELVERSADGGSFKARDTSGKDLGWISKEYLVPLPPHTNE